MQPDTHYAKAGDLNIAYQVIGDGPLDLVFVPGIVSHLDMLWTSADWERFALRLASFARVVFFDKRGTGLSDPTPGADQLDARMDDIRAVMDAVGMESAAIFGISEGGPLAVLFAATYPERVRSLALYGTFARIFDDPKVVRPMEEAFANWGEGRLLTLLGPSFKETALARFSAGLFERAMASPRMAATLWETLKEIDIRPILSAVRAPTLVLHRRDEYLPIEGARELAAGIPGARLIELEGINHIPWIGDIESILDPVEEFFTGTRHVSDDADRVLATVLFTDIVGSTERNVDAGDEEWRRLLDRHNQTVRSLVQEHRGRAVKTVGDGFLCVFDGPARALRCAKAVVEEVHRLGIDVRVGLHTGELETYDDGDVGGMAVNIGARIGAEARGGEVLVSSTLKDLVFGSRLRFAPRGTHQLKGLPGEWALFAFDGEAGHELPTEHPMDSMGAVSRASVKFMMKRPKLARKINRLVFREKDQVVPTAPA
jgi:class 3 adenylate cyclase/pimeloyl-ACP methyl ester carboxylesterase